MTYVFAKKTSLVNIDLGREKGGRAADMVSYTSSAWIICFPGLHETWMHTRPNHGQPGQISCPGPEILYGLICFFYLIHAVLIHRENVDSHQQLRLLSTNFVGSLLDVSSFIGLQISKLWGILLGHVDKTPSERPHVIHTDVGKKKKNHLKFLTCGVYSWAIVISH